MIQIRLLINTIRRSWWIIAIATIIATNIALFLSYQEEPVYRTQARFVVSPNPSISETDDFMDGINTVDNLVSTYAEILNSSSIRRLTVAQIPAPPDNIDDYVINAVVLPESSVLELTVTGPDPEMAADIANFAGAVTIDYTRSLYQIYVINPLDPAGAPDDPISPNPVRDAGLAAVLGFVFGAALAFVREQIIVALTS